MKRTSGFFYENSNLKVACLCTAIFVAYLVVVMKHQATGFEISNSNISSLGMTFGFNEADILAFFNARTDRMVDAYINFNRIWDTFFGLIYGLMYVVWLSVLFKPFSKKVGFINLIPLLQVLFDWLENYTLGFLAQQYLLDGAITPYMAVLASYFGMIKWTFSGFTYSLIILGMSLLIARFFKTKGVVRYL